MELPATGAASVQPRLVHNRSDRSTGARSWHPERPGKCGPHLPADSVPAAGTKGLASTADAIELMLCAEPSDLADSGEAEWLPVAAASAAAPAAAAAGSAAWFGVPAMHTPVTHSILMVRLHMPTGKLTTRCTHGLKASRDRSGRQEGQHCWPLLRTRGAACFGRHAAQADAQQQPCSAAPSQTARRSAGARPGVTGAASSDVGMAALVGGLGPLLASSAIAICLQALTRAGLLPCA